MKKTNNILFKLVVLLGIMIIICAIYLFIIQRNIGYVFLALTWIAIVTMELVDTKIINDKDYCISLGNDIIENQNRIINSQNDMINSLLEERK